VLIKALLNNLKKTGISGNIIAVRGCTLPLSLCKSGFICLDIGWFENMPPIAN
jgi:hypothetical protein